MRIVVMGTGGFAVPSFASVLEAGHEVPALITRPVPPAIGRKKEQLHPNPMREFAESRGLPVFAPTSTREADAQQLLRELRPDLFLVCDFGEILARETLAIPPLGGINLHASLLPKYRGAAPINWAILRGERETGVSVLHMTPLLDGGPILARRITPIADDETTPALEHRLSVLGVDAVAEAITLLGTWDRHSTLGELQDAASVTSARRLRKTDGEVKWSRPAIRIRNQVRALKPWPGVYTHLAKSGGPPVRLILDWVSLVPHAAPSDLPPGSVMSASDAHVWVQTADGVLALERVQPAGKRVLSIQEFQRGYRCEVGQLFVSEERPASA